MVSVLMVMLGLLSGGQAGPAQPAVPVTPLEMAKPAHEANQSTVIPLPARRGKRSADPLDDYSEFDLPPEELTAHEHEEANDFQLMVWLTRGVCFGVPLLVLVLWGGYMLLMVVAPSVGYRLAGWLPWSHPDRSKMRREMSDLETQLAARDLPHLRYKLGRVSLLLGRPDRAVELLTPVVARDSTHVDAAYFLGRAHLARGNAEAALSVLDVALAAKPDHDYGGLRLARAQALLTVGRYPEAIEELRTLLRSSPDLPAGLYWLGEAHAALGDRPQALSAWQACRQSWQSGSTTFRRQNREWMRRARARLWFG